jgi:hypothetical protein
VCRSSLSYSTCIVATILLMLTLISMMVVFAMRITTILLIDLDLKVECHCLFHRWCLGIVSLRLHLCYIMVRASTRICFPDNRTSGLIIIQRRMLKQLCSLILRLLILVLNLLIGELRNLMLLLYIDTMTKYEFFGRYFTHWNELFACMALLKLASLLAD